MEQGALNRLQETKLHGDILFPFNIYPCTIPQDFPSVALHWHRDMEIIYVKKGSMIVRMAMRDVRAEAGDICIIPPGALHALRTDGGKQAEYENIIFDPEMLGSGGADICARRYLVPIAAGRLLSPLYLQPEKAGYDAARRCLAHADELCGARGMGWELGVKAAMLDLILALLQLQPDAVEMEAPDADRLKRVIGCIQQEYASRMKVEDVAERIGCSPSHFMRWFRQMTGNSFVNFLNEYRLAEAARQLRSTDEKILTIAHNVGFDSLSNFNRQFKLRYMMTPREYRREGWE